MEDREIDYGGSNRERLKKYKDVGKNEFVVELIKYGAKELRRQNFDDTS